MSARDHCAEKPVSLVGTFCRPAADEIRVVARGTGTLPTARKSLWNLSQFPITRACKSLSSGSRIRIPPLIDFHNVSFASSQLGSGCGTVVQILAFWRSSEKYPPRANALNRSEGL